MIQCFQFFDREVNEYMKRLLSLLLILCLTLGMIPLAHAAITVTEQPETTTVKAGGNVTFRFKGKNVSGSGITWYFINPVTGETTTGKKLSSVVPGIKVANPNNPKITLKRVPESMHGWIVYCHIGKKSGGVDTDKVMLLIEGKEPPANMAELLAAPPAAADNDDGGAKSDGAGDSDAIYVTATPEPPTPIVITGSKVELYQLDRSGDIVGTAQTELTFPVGSSANFYVKLPEGTEGTLQYFTIGGIRFDPEGDNVTGMAVRGWTTSAAVRAKVLKPGDETPTPAPAATEEPVDESSLVTVTCTFCRFTGWHNTFSESGKVPVGSTITVAASGGMISKGYSINGAKASHRNEAAFQLVVEGDTTIVMDEQNASSSPLWN